VTVLLLHALPLDERMWEPQREAFGSLEVAAPRLYGRGPTMDAWASRLLAEVDGDVVLVGASMGGYCALAIARVAPERVRGLVLTGSRADADTPERRAARADTIDLIRREGAPGLWESMRPKLFPADADPALVGRARAIALEQRPDELVQAVEAIRDRPDSTAALHVLGERTLAVIGEEDPFVRGDEVPAHEVHVLPGCGHLPSLQRATEFNELVGRRIAAWTA
jgi:pimeloyl-ACP methyl ester carboxylesterase